LYLVQLNNENEKKCRLYDFACINLVGLHTRELI
jgi:hypothetical protein